MERFEADVIAMMDGKGTEIIEARKAEIEKVRKVLRDTPWEKRESLYRRLRELLEELDVIMAV